VVVNVTCRTTGAAAGRAELTPLAKHWRGEHRCGHAGRAGSGANTDVEAFWPPGRLPSEPGPLRAGLRRSARAVWRSGERNLGGIELGARGPPRRGKLPLQVPGLGPPAARPYIGTSEACCCRPLRSRSGREHPPRWHGRLTPARWLQRSGGLCAPRPFLRLDLHAAASRLLRKPASVACQSLRRPEMLVQQGKPQRLRRLVGRAGDGRPPFRCSDAAAPSTSIGTTH